MSILILGGSGYLGSKIAHLFLKKCADSSNSIICTCRMNASKVRLDDIRDQISIIPPTTDAIETVLKKEHVDTVINMICNYGRSNMLYDSVLEANVELPLKILNYSVEYGVKRFLSIGTGLPDEFNMYSFSKKMFSEFGRFYSEKHKIDFFNLKLEMFYGADEPKDRFIPNLITRMLDGEPIDVTIGTQYRDIIRIEDVVNAVDLVCGCDLSGYRSIPVGTGIAPTISEFVDFIWEKTGKRSIVRKGAIPMRENEPDCCADTRLLREIGDWHPAFWQDGISAMIQTMASQKY